MAGSASLAAYGNRELIPGSRSKSRDQIARFIKQNVMTTYHYAGTCRMGTDPDSVVDGARHDAAIRQFAQLAIDDAGIADGDMLERLGLRRGLIPRRGVIDTLQVRGPDGDQRALNAGIEAWVVPRVELDNADGALRANLYGSNEYFNRFGDGDVIQWLGRQLRQRLVDIGVDDPVLQTLLTVLIPYAAYLAAEALQVSGILAVVIAGLWTGGKEVRGLSAESRRHAREVWRMISYVFNGLVFVLLGLQLRHMLAAVGHYDAAWLAGLAFGVWALLMALRLSWVWLSAHVRFRLQWGWAGARSGPDGRRMFLVGWAAVRGSVTLATALSVPLLTTAGLPFPQRDLVVFLAAATIVLTLALNGIPLPWLIRKLQPPADDEDAREESAARVALARAGIAAVQSVLAQRADDQGRDFAEQLIHRYEGKITLREGDAAAAAVKAEHISGARQLRLAGIQAERDCLHRLHAQTVINDETLRLLEEELDEREMLSSADALRG